MPLTALNLGQTRYSSDIDNEGTRDGRFGCKVGQIGHQIRQIRGFLDQISVHLSPPGAPNALKSDLKKPRICPIWGPI